ncbi:MAG TPA: FAD-dependent oxidoreductase, partial [Candidatus Methanomethylicus sp.]|nr:FAD-dependent oxidoreductase [Candidatus Methanomethylicus sp.]
MHDVLVVGGGPAGLLAGAAAAEMGARVKVLEEDGEVGEPDHCAGVVSSRGVRALVGGRGAVINEIRGARIFSPTGRCYTVRAGDVKAYVVDRPRFDREMRRMAEGAGAEVETGVRYAKGMECKVLVVAEGTRAMVARRLGFEVPRSIPAAQLDFDADSPEPDMVE